MRTVTRTAKVSALQLARHAGVFSIAQRSNWRATQLLVLCYHGISTRDEHLWDSELYLPPQFFRNRLELIRKKGYRVVSLDQGLKELQQGSLLEPSVTLTFDDGAYDFYTQAWPILKEFGYPCTVYLTSFYSSFNRPVFDTICSYLVWQGAGKRLSLPAVTGQPETFDLASPEAVQAARSHIMSHVRANKISAEEKDAIARRLAGVVSVNYDQILETRFLHLMNPCEVREIATAGVDIQLHTHRHRTPLDKAMFEAEIHENRTFIESLTGRPAVHFCYPSGAYHSQFLPWLRESGVQSAVTCDPGLMNRAKEPLLTPRFVDSFACQAGEFEGWLSGVASLLPRRRASYSEFY